MTSTKYQIATPDEYLSARLSLLAREKELTRTHDEVAAARRALPMVAMSKPYKFSTVDGEGMPTEVGLADLFEGRSQLIIFHFMFDPAWEAGCPYCTMYAKELPPLEQLQDKSTSFVVVSRAPIEKIEAHKKRMNWTFPWVSSFGSDFNYDFHVTLDEVVAPVVYNYRSKAEWDKRGMGMYTRGEHSGHSCFVMGDGKEIGEAGQVYHTYSCYYRGSEGLGHTSGWLDLTILGRQDGKKGTVALESE